MKKYLLLLFFILTILLTACKKNQLHNSDTKLTDSVQYYFIRYNDTISSDSVKKTYNDKAFIYNKGISNDSIRIKNNDTIAYYYYKVNDFSKYGKITKSNLKESIDLKDTSRIAKSYVNYGNFYLRRNIADSAYFSFDKAQRLYLQINQFEEINELSLSKATAQYFEGDYLGCETTILKSLSLKKKENNDLNLNKAYTLIGISKIELKEFNDAIEYLNLALDLTKNINVKKASRDIALNNLGLAYFKKEQYNRAVEYYEKAVSIAGFKSNNLQAYTLSKQFLLFSKFKLGKNKDFVKNFEEIIKDYSMFNLSPVLPRVQLSEFYQSQNQFEKAQESALEAYNVSIKDKVYREKLIALKQLINVFPNKIKYYSDEYIKLADSITAIDRKTQNTFASIEYKVDELNNEKTLLQQEKEQFTLYAIIAFMLVLFLGTLLWFIQKQKRLKTENRVQVANQRIYQLMLDQQTKYEEGKVNERKRIARELHDSIMNKLTAIRFNLYPLKEKTSQEAIEKSLHYIDEIHTVEKELRAISNDLNLISNDKNDNFEVLIHSIYAFVKDSDTKVYFKFEETINWQSIKSNTKLQLYRIVQESVFNCIKHAKATQCTISFSKTPIAILLTIIDDGRGLGENKNAKGMGLKNIKERTKNIAGKIKIESKMNKGTAIYITIPMEENTN